jgi:uncharacterized protein
MFIDVHVHAYLKPVPKMEGVPYFSSPEQVLAMYDKLEIEKGALLPLVNPEIWLPQANEDMLKIAARYPDRFFPFCNLDPRALANSPKANFGPILRYYRDLGCRGVGEFMPNLYVNHPMVQNFFHHCEEAGLPLLFDMAATKPEESYGLCDDAGLPQLEASLRRFPKLVFIGHGPVFWAEIGRLEEPEDRLGYPKDRFTEEGAVPKLMRRYSNLHVELSAGSGHNALARNPEYAVKFLNEFADRTMYGTDICSPDVMPPPTAQMLKDFRAKGLISEEIFRRIAKENAVRLLNLT